MASELLVMLQEVDAVISILERRRSSLARRLDEYEQKRAAVYTETREET